MNGHAMLQVYGHKEKISDQLAEMSGLAGARFYNFVFRLAYSRFANSEYYYK